MAKKILVVDDERDILEVIIYILTDSGYEIYGQLSGEKLLDVVNEFHPDLIVMDIMLGNMDGREICRLIKSRYGSDELPVILISAGYDIKNSLDFVNGPDDFVAKPFDIDNLLDAVRTQLVKSSS